MSLLSRAGSSVRRLWHAYEDRLSRSPLSTQASTSTLLWGFGDYLAQTVGEGRSSTELDTRRTFLTSLFGGGFIGPLGHYWYLILDRRCRRIFDPVSQTVAFVAAKVAADTVTMGPFYLCSFYAYGSLVLDRTGMKGFYEKIEKDLVPMLVAEIFFWPAFQLCNFSKVPVRHQLLAGNGMALLDASFLSWARAKDDWLSTLAA
eukprot:CAMPEP_0175043156 /NCGR_PEP_ID=MMETSP0052_2-20121109/3005_1 /TAXON_ID=51329 ORGANISM="Polytomella parva, Strain SAG 63-3" /NCGR_SAMPLE_ID=MMETSP0052_2 /ASSEMBLY_ACC=CAM_ASM_000194 /LENGTH=202 /DNA_ID=CAMNT_0016306133 /DNA_START=92 /DNA_END=697 /DNA_ORIENTATION=+